MPVSGFARSAAGPWGLVLAWNMDDPLDRARVLLDACGVTIEELRLSIFEHDGDADLLEMDAYLNGLMTLITWDTIVLDLTLQDHWGH